MEDLDPDVLDSILRKPALDQVSIERPVQDLEGSKTDSVFSQSGGTSGSIWDQIGQLAQEDNPW
jgi:hypothetical protein